jgi:Protein of unknown function (DUF1156)
MNIQDQRLIERGFPCHQVGAETQRERGMSTALPAHFALHVWWARRPLTSSRAAIVASLDGADADPETFIRQLGIERVQALDRAKRSGDVVRAARVAALKSLVLAETSEDVTALLAQHKAELDDAARVGDGFALGMHALALGRWHVGAGGLALASATGRVAGARRSLALLREAVDYFRNQGMDPWVLFALVQQTKAHADLHRFDEAQACIDAAVEGLERFPILASHVYEAVGQVRTM